MTLKELRLDLTQYIPLSGRFSAGLKPTTLLQRVQFIGKQQQVSKALLCLQVHQSAGKTSRFQISTHIAAAQQSPLTPTL